MSKAQKLIFSILLGIGIIAVNNLYLYSIVKLTGTMHWLMYPVVVLVNIIGIMFTIVFYKLLIRL